MDSQLTQRTRYLLQARVRTAKTCPTPLFPSALAQWLAWLEADPLLGGLLAPLWAKATDFEAKLRADLAKLGTPQITEIVGPLVQASLRDATALYLAALRIAATMNTTDENDRQERWP